MLCEFKGDGYPDDYYIFYMKNLNKPWILIPVPSSLVETRRSCGGLNIYKWTVMEVVILWVLLWNFETTRGSLMTPDWQKIASLSQDICKL